MSIPPNKLQALLAQLRSGIVPAADATAVARNKGAMPLSPEEAAARPLESDFAQHRDSLYRKYSGETRDYQYPADWMERGNPLLEPISGFEDTPKGRQVDSAFTDVSMRAGPAADARRNANAALQKLMALATKQFGQRKVP